MSHADLAPTRRSVVAGGALIASSAPTLVAAPTLGAAFETRLLALCAALDDCHVARQAYEEVNPDDDADPFYDKHWDLRKQINSIEARTLPALRAKARAAEHAFFYDPTAACHCAGSFRELARSIIADIARLQQVTA